MDRKVILLVEDTPDDEALTLRALRKNGFDNRIVVARDGQEARELLLRREPLLHPAVVLLALKLPKIDGLEVLRRTRADERTACLPVVILTSSREDRDIVDGFRSGANTYVRKPVDFLRFSDAIRNMGLYWLLLHQPLPNGGAT